MLLNLNLQETKPGAQSKLAVYDEFSILDSILARPGMYLQQKVNETTGNTVHESTICHFLRRNNFSRKRFSLVAAQQSTEKRAQFLSDVSIHKPEMLIFVDETGTDRRNSIRRYGYCLVGKPARSHSLLVRGKRFSAIGILSVSGILDTFVTADNVNGEVFQEFFEKSLLRHVMPFNGTTLIVFLFSTTHLYTIQMLFLIYCGV